MNGNSVTLFCLIHGDDTNRAFSLKVTKDTTIDELKERIKAEKSPKFDNIAADELALRKANVSLDEYDQESDPESFGEELSPVSEIAEVFPDGWKKNIYTSS